MTAGGSALALGYGWWLSGLPSFSTKSYVAIAVPIALLFVGAVWPRARATQPGDSWSAASRPLARRFGPAFGLLAAAVILEGVALGLGGRSRELPTVSTVLDHAVAHRVGRFLGFEIWLAIGLSRWLIQAPSRRTAVGTRWH